MTTFGPPIMDKTKWKEKTISFIRTDIDEHKGIAIGYAIPFFDHSETDPEKQFTFAIRLAHSLTYMDEGQKLRLEQSLKHIMMGVQKIFTVDIAELKKWASGEDGGKLSNYTITGKFD